MAKAYSLTLVFLKCFFLRLRLIYAKPTPHKLGADLVQDTETVENTAFDRHGPLSDEPVGTTELE